MDKKKYIETVTEQIRCKRALPLVTKELEDPTEEEIKEYLAGNLCRCSGFVGQTRSILKYLECKKNGNIQEKEVQA